ncbi:hypothetical protein HELRODRAFT_167433 [Helobdella robusta]|uniref:Uncharacterized protein n=1 Tax=Helobdella robusta TaxID=6412 RepID=T1EZD1_HELRO|nr:hypothetical protein HELRODRAFT_167433 [Helobdella robusta]ESO10917.1 hypothetical protein HELRODRAFT_167433 [Helobdella robusta]
MRSENISYWILNRILCDSVVRYDEWEFRDLEKRSKKGSSSREKEDREIIDRDATTMHTTSSSYSSSSHRHHRSYYPHHNTLEGSTRRSSVAAILSHVTKLHQPHQPQHQPQQQPNNTGLLKKPLYRNIKLAQQHHHDDKFDTEKRLYQSIRSGKSRLELPVTPEKQEEEDEEEVAGSKLNE